MSQTLPKLDLVLGSLGLVLTLGAMVTFLFLRSPFNEEEEEQPDDPPTAPSPGGGRGGLGPRSSRGPLARSA
jgi:hypothetical protein